MMLVLLLVFATGAFALRDCPVNSHYESCGTACPLTCENHKNPPKFCVLMCNPGCHCDPGYVKANDGSCVFVENCPNRAPEVCGENEHYNGCGTACPLTCDNFNNPPKICPAMCKIGCECKTGFVRSPEGRCISPEKCPNRSAERKPKNCVDKPVRGRCMAYFPSYFYDTESKVCRIFIYGGCGGNGNRYRSEEECVAKCAKQPELKLFSADESACDQPKVVGHCFAAFRRFYFNKESGKCEEFIYGGCGANDNNFLTMEDCEELCLS